MANEKARTRSIVSIPGGLRPEEVGALRAYRRELEGQGHEVVELAVMPGGGPGALVVRRSRENGQPIRKFIMTCRSLLDQSMGLPATLEISSEERETLVATRTTLATAVDCVLNFTAAKTVADAARNRVSLAVSDADTAAEKGEGDTPRKPAKRLKRIKEE